MIAIGPPEPKLSSLLLLGAGPGGAGSGIENPPADERMFEDGTQRALEEHTIRGFESGPG